MLLGDVLDNTLAFSGSNYLLSMTRSSGVDKERKRHDIAVEQQQTAQANWSRRRSERLDWINEEHRRQNHAVQTFRDGDVAMRSYAQVTGETLDPLGPEPLLSDFSTPSVDQKDCKNFFLILGMAAMGLVSYKLAKLSDRTLPVWGLLGCWNIFPVSPMTDIKLSARFSSIYYRPKGYWKDIAAITNLPATAKVSEYVARGWLKKQAIWQIYVPAHGTFHDQNSTSPRRTRSTSFSRMIRSDAKTYKYALTVVDVASRLKAAEPLATKEAKEVAETLSRIYRWWPLTWPKLLQVDPGRELSLIQRHASKSSASLLCCSNEDIAHRSACAPGACSGRGLSGLGLWSRCSGICGPSQSAAGWCGACWQAVC